MTLVHLRMGSVFQWSPDALSLNACSTQPVIKQSGISEGSDDNNRDKADNYSNSQ